MLFISKISCLNMSALRLRVDKLQHCKQHVKDLLLKYNRISQDFPPEDYAIVGNDICNEFIQLEEYERVIEMGQISIRTYRNLTNLRAYTRIASTLYFMSLAWYGLEKFSNSLDYAQQSLDEYMRLNATVSDGIDCLLLMAFASDGLGNSNQTLKYASLAFNYGKRKPSNQAAVLYGYAYLVQLKAFKRARNALKTFSDILYVYNHFLSNPTHLNFTSRDFMNIARALSGMGDCYVHLGDHLNASKYYAQSMQVYEMFEIKRVSFQAEALICNMVQEYKRISIGDYDEENERLARKFLQKCQEFRHRRRAFSQVVAAKYEVFRNRMFEIWNVFVLDLFVYFFCAFLVFLTFLTLIRFSKCILYL